MTEDFTAYTPEEQPQAVETAANRLTLGLPRCDNPLHRQVALTPEGAALLVERGFRVKVERGAGDNIHYGDDRYAAHGAEITDHTDAWGCDIVVHPAPPSPADTRLMRRGALLFTLLNLREQTRESLAGLLAKRVTTLALDLIEDRSGNTPFADILAEIDGRAAVTIGAGILADAYRAKGILLGGVSGIVPCEVCITGSGIAAKAAAKSAAGLGALVRMFDNDVYRLRRTARDLGPSVVTSALHPRVFSHALHSADMLIATPMERPLHVTAEMLATVKRGALLFDLTGRLAPSFPTLRCVDMGRGHATLRATAPGERLVFVNPGGAVLRTAAMAMTNALVTTFDKMTLCRGGVPGMLRLMPGLRRAAVTYLGHVVNPAVARRAGVRQIDINIYLAMS